MNFGDITINGQEVRALRHGMAGETDFELHGPQEYGGEIWDVLFEAGQEYGIRWLGWKAYMTTRIISELAQGTEYISAIYDDDMKEYRKWMDADSYEATTSLAGSFTSDDISAWYRSPVELGGAHVHVILSRFHRAGSP